MSEAKSAKDRFFHQELVNKQELITKLQCELFESRSTVVFLQSRLKKLKNTEKDLKDQKRLVIALKVRFLMPKNIQRCNHLIHFSIYPGST